MNRTTLQVRNYLALVILAAAPKLMAQAAPQPAAAAPETAEDIITLDPFSVSADDEKSGYAVKDTLAGTRVRTDLKDVASSIVVVNKQLMQDIGATNNETLLQYTGNTEVGGTGGNFLGGSYPSASDAYGQNAGLLRPNNNTRVRGLDSADNTRDFFQTEIPWDSYVVDRVDIQRGPNSILFGVGSPAGVINSSVNQPSFKTAYSFENKLDRWGSLRNSIDINQVLLKKTLALRIAGVDDRKKYEQKPAFENTDRLFGALRYEPKLIESGATSIRANFEHGRIRANRPRSLPPEDYITPWFSSMGKQSFDPSSQSPISNAFSNNPWIKNQATGRQYWPGTVAYYSDVNGNTKTSYMTPLISERNGIGSDGLIDKEIGGQIWTRNFAITSYKSYMSNTGVDGAGYYGTKSLTDASIFNFYENLIDGDNKSEWQNWNAANLSISQTAFDNRLGFSFVYDRQRYNDGQQTIFNGGGAYSLSVDINSKLIDGSANPNYGRPFVAGDTRSGGNDSYIDRDAVRFTPYTELRSEDFLRKSWLTQLLGKHIITGLLGSDLKEQRDRQWALDLASTDYPAYLGEDVSFGGNVRSYNWEVYLGDSLKNASSAAGANLSRISAAIASPATAAVRIFDNHWNSTVNPAAAYSYTDAEGKLVSDSTQSENPANYIGWSNRNVNFLSVTRGDKASLMTADSLKRNKVKSEGITWQGYMLDDTFVPVFGWRKDTVTMRKGTDAADALGMVDGNYSFDPSRDLQQSGISKSWGGVLHTPKAIRKKLPGNTDISLFYNRSSNFKADEPRQDVFGNMVDNARAQTKEYGFAISTLDDKLSLKVNWYETKMKNATLPYGTGFTYMMWATPAWYVAQAARYQASVDGLHNDPDWDWKNIAAEQAPSYSFADIMKAAKGMPLSQSFFNSYGKEVAMIDIEAFKAGDVYKAWPLWTDWRGDPQPGADAVSRVGTADTTSKGIEFDLTAQPTPNWNLSVNVSKVKAQYDAVSPTIASFMDSMTAFFNGPAGDLRMWGESWKDNSFKKKWNDEVVTSYNTLLAYVGNSAPEVAPWRANFITTYSFDGGALKGFFVGGGYRWEDRKLLGYGLTANPKVNNKLMPDSGKPLYGSSDDHIDLWVGYSRKLSSKIKWKVQLNVRNVGENHHLVAASLEPDGTVALARIAEGMSAQLTNTFSF